MNLFYSFFASVLILINVVADVPYSELEAAFSQSNANEIIHLGKDRILLNILGEESIYSQSQATMILKDFFNKKPISSFKFIFKSKENTDNSFAIATYTSKGNENFRVTIHFKKIGNDFKIESLTIEKA